MPARTQPINLVDFRGGLNLRANEFSLAENESPDMLNVDVDPRSGIQTRKGWERWNVADITPAEDWNPRHAYIHELASGLDVVMVTNDGKILTTTNGTFSELEYADGVPLPVGAGTHLADFASWGDDVYIVGGAGNQSAKWDGTDTYCSLITGINSGTDFADEYTEPGANVRFPEARYATSHGGRVWTAYTTESGTTYPHRVRWSHPNQPERWASQDYVDILEGGGPITSLVPHDDHLLVFKQSSVWAIYGYDAETLQVVNVSRAVGAYSHECTANAESAVYFVSWPQGVFRISNGEMREISLALRPALDSTAFNKSALNYMWLGWLGQKLWWSVPYNEESVVDDASSIFVFDPSLESWTKYRSSMDAALGPYAQGGYGQGSVDKFGFCRCGPAVVRVDQRDTATDTVSGESVGFKSRYTTRWLHDGWPDRKKRWKRPSFLAQERAEPYRLQCTVFTDYGEQDVKRKFAVSVNPAGDGAVLYDGGATYDDGSLYDESDEGTDIRRVSGFGSNRAIQLQIDGELGKAWGLDGIVFKYRPRRFA